MAQRSEEVYYNAYLLSQRYVELKEDLEEVKAELAQAHLNLMQLEKQWKRLVGLTVVPAEPNGDG